MNTYNPPLQSSFNDDDTYTLSVFQSQPSSLRGSFQEQRARGGRDQRFLATLRQLIEERIDDSQLGIKLLCSATFTSHTQLYRRLKSLTGMNPTTYIRTIRLEKARKRLQRTDESVSEIAYSTGFSDPNYFSRVFRRHFGLAPSQLRN